VQVSEVKLKRESERELFFAHYPLGGVVVAVFGAAFGYLPTYLGADPGTRWVFDAGGGFLALVGLFGAFWRYELRLDLLARTYTRRRGFWPSPKRATGSLDELKGVILTQQWDRSSSSRGGATYHPWWKVSLDFQGWEKPVSIEALGSEQKGQERLEYYAKKLKVPAVDRTGELEKKRNWDELDLGLADRERRPLAEERQVAAVDPSVPPPRSRIRVTGYPGHRAVVLPSLGCNGGMVFLVLFGLVFAAFAVFFMLAKSGLYTELTGKGITVTESSPLAGWIISSLFLLIGLGIMMLGVVGSYGIDEIEESGEALIYRFRFLNWPLRSRRVLKREIEEIELRGDISPQRAALSTIKVGKFEFGTTPGKMRAPVPEVFIRSDKQIFRIGQHLSQAEKEWLEAALTQMATSGR
jgi:hypothetical protein